MQAKALKSKFERKENMDFPANKPEKPGYTLEFSDGFEGSQLDQNKWFPFMLPHWSTLEDSAAKYRLDNGSLKLLIEQNHKLCSAVNSTGRVERST